MTKDKEWLTEQVSKRQHGNTIREVKPMMPDSKDKDLTPEELVNWMVEFFGT